MFSLRATVALPPTSFPRNLRIPAWSASDAASGRALRALRDATRAPALPFVQPSPMGRQRAATARQVPPAAPRTIPNLGETIPEAGR